LTRLRFLYCNDNALTDLNVTSLTNLRFLYCNDNALTDLNVTSLTNLEYLDCNNNSLINLDVTGLTNLQDLYCNNNSLINLDVTGLTNLQNLNCDNNSLLDVSGDFSLATVSGADQERTIGMIVNPSGGFVSEEAYPFGTNHTIGGLDAGVTFGPDNRFYLDNMIASSPFITSLATAGGQTVSGTLYFEHASYSVTFLDWDNTVLQSSSVVAGTSATAPADPTREGYVFIGWDTDFSNITRNTTVTALYEAIPIPDPTNPTNPTNPTDPTPTPPLPTTSDKTSTPLSTVSGESLPATGDAPLAAVLALIGLTAAGTLGIFRIRSRR